MFVDKSKMHLGDRQKCFPWVQTTASATLLLQNTHYFNLKKHHFYCLQAWKLHTQNENPILFSSAALWRNHQIS